MKIKKFFAPKTPAQAMVEFAIALPVLLLLLYGILEAGRYLFIYSSIVTASRQAVRYGSATGQGLNYTTEGGPNNTTVKRYNDCYGIRRAAKKADYLNAFTDANIYIYHDDGPTVPPSATGKNEAPYCAGTSDNWDPSNNRRLVVKIEGNFNPLVKLVPFIERTVANGHPIVAKSARTILVSVSIAVTAPPATWQASTPTFTPSPTPSPTNTPTNTPTATSTPTATQTPLPSKTPTGTPPTPTRTATATSTGTATNTATPIPTPLASCTGIAHGTIQYSGDTMTMTVTNPFSFALTMNDVTVTWNDDKGHKTGTDKTLVLQTALVNGIQFWSGSSVLGESTKTLPGPILFNPGINTITFTFDKSYDNPEVTDKVYITWLTPGCQNDPVDSSK